MKLRRIKRPHGSYLFIPRKSGFWVVAVHNNVYQLVGYADCEQLAQLMADIDDSFHHHDDTGRANESRMIP
jgi:hypothetical protein